MARIARLVAALALALVFGAIACGARVGPPAERTGAGTAPAVTPPPQPLPPPLPPSNRRDLARGKFLIATHKLTGPYFAQTVVLLLDYGPKGALGLIVNRPTGIALAKLLPDVTPLRERKDEVYSGGPVDPHAMTFLLRVDVAPPSSHHVVDDIYASGSKEALLHLLGSDPDAKRLRTYVGYAGWASGQLDAEVQRGDWFIAASQADLIFGEAGPEMWQKLIQQHGGVQVRRRNGPERSSPRAASG